MSDSMKQSKLVEGAIVIPLFVEYLVDWYRQGTAVEFTRRFYDCATVTKVEPLEMICTQGNVVWTGMNPANFICVGQASPEFLSRMQTFAKVARQGELTRPSSRSNRPGSIKKFVPTVS